MQNDKLLPCPFCGGEVELLTEEVDATREAYNFHCDNCDMSTYYDYPNDREDAIKQWNTRKPMERIVEHLEEKSSLNHLEKMEERVGKKQTQGFGLGISCAIDIVKGGVDNG